MKDPYFLRPFSRAYDRCVSNNAFRHTRDIKLPEPKPFDPSSTHGPADLHVPQTAPDDLIGVVNNAIMQIDRREVKDAFGNAQRCLVASSGSNSDWNDKELMSFDPIEAATGIDAKSREYQRISQVENAKLSSEMTDLQKSALSALESGAWFSMSKLEEE